MVAKQHSIPEIIKTHGNLSSTETFRRNFNVDR